MTDHEVWRLIGSMVIFFVIGYCIARMMKDR